MRRSALKTAFAAIAVAAGVLWACGATEEVKFGGPNALSKDKAPPTPGQGTTGADAGGDGAVCKPAGDGGCSVKWSTDIVPLFGDDAGWGCSKGGSCHGGAASPPINNNDPKQAYDQLRAYTAIRGAAKPYINPCSLNPADSTFQCNLSAAPNNCGSPMPKGSAALAADMAKLDTWLKCGSPNN